MKSTINALARSHTRTFKAPSNGMKTSIQTQDLKYQFVLQFNPQTTQEQLLSVCETLQEYKFFPHLITLPSEHLLFLALVDSTVILEQAEHMHIYKLTYEKQHEEVHEVYRKISEKLNMRRILDEKLVAKLNQIDKRILVYENYKKFKYIDKADFSHINDDNQIVTIFSSSEQILIIYNYLHSIKVGDMEMIHFLKTENYLKAITPIHDPQIKAATISEIENYFGGNIAVYFEFMSFYQNMLKPLALFAILAIALDQSKFPISNIASLYALITMIWTTLFIILWRRQENELGIEWGILGFKHNKKLELNPEFKGTPALNLITGHLRLTYSKTNRYFYYMVSLIEALPILLFAGMIKIVVFNINGLIKNKNSWFFIPAVASLNQEGGLLHSQHTAQILDFLTILLIFYINILYTKISVNSTRRENHKTNISFYNSVILKRFLFELINRFFHLFYIGFGEFDIPALRSQLTKLFILDQLRRVGLESLLPLVMKSTNKKILLNKKNDQIEERFAEAIEELQLWEYDDFDDYIEVVFQYGYIVLFAAIFPLAVPLTVIFNFLEIWSDKFKLVNKLYQRSLPKKISSIGQWRLVLTALSVMSIYTNTAFISFQYFNLFETCQQDDCNWEKILVLLFVFEHVTLGLKYTFTQLVPSKPKWVRIVLKRIEHSRKLILR